MGLEEFKPDQEDGDEDNEDETVQEKQEQTTKEHIASNVRHRVYKHDMDIDIEDGRLEGDINDIAMLFALMTMDNVSSEFDNLINDGE
jgi:hypothetical protein